MKMIEIDLNIMSAPQSYYLAQGISKDLNFSTGLPALFERMYGMKEKIEASYVDDYTDNVDIELGEAILVDNVFNLIVKENSYNKPDSDRLLDAIVNMKLAIPKICCGRNGLEWDDVRSMFEFVFADSDVQILVCIQ